MDKFLISSSTFTQLGEMHHVIDTTRDTTLKLTPTQSTIVLIDIDSPIKEVNDKPPTTRKKPIRNSTIWDHFTKVKDENSKDPKCICKCNYCGKYYACDRRRVGTNNLWVHLNIQCKGFKQGSI